MFDCSFTPVTWGEHLRWRRHYAEKSMCEVAEAVGISQSELSLIERDKVIPRLDTVVWLAIYYGVTLDELIGHACAAEGR